MISVVIRAYNEAAWLNRCLYAVAHQRQRVSDVILVDNESIDASRTIAESYGARIIPISRSEFSYGRALNLGIAAAKYQTVILLSAHCIPADELWSDYLDAHIGERADARTCGVYGRQEPLPDTSDIDARDLWTTFREERQVQTTDYFFHNANSAIRKSAWNELPFDEEINGVEDRAWAKLMLAAGWRIVYEPHARVYHFHGIHQGHHEARARRVAQVIRHIRDNL